LNSITQFLETNFYTMKFVSILAVASTMFGLANGQASLAQKWNISEDASFEYSSLSFKLGYTVSDFISEATSGEMARFVIYDDGCKDTGSEINANSTSGLSAITADLAGLTGTSGNGFAMDRTAYVNITIDAEAISSNPLIYSEDTTGSQVTAEIRFCLRFSLHTKSVTSVEVNFLETLVTLNVDLTDGFEIGSIAVEPRDRLVRTANQVYMVIGFRCDAQGLPLGNQEAINQGTVVRVCVKPDADAEADGIKMRSIDDFTWSRPIPGGTSITQPAITGRNRPAANQLTTLTCTPGSDMCSFETILFAAFYTSAGAVLGSGVASMQFGSTDTSGGRRLRGDTEGRDLQEDDAAAASEFELDFDVGQATAQATSGAASYGVMASMVFGMIAAALI
jgi:hypothetical protein